MLPVWGVPKACLTFAKAKDDVGQLRKGTIRDFIPLANYHPSRRNIFSSVFIQQKERWEISTFLSYDRIPNELAKSARLTER